MKTTYSNQSKEKTNIDSFLLKYSSKFLPSVILAYALALLLPLSAWAEADSQLSSGQSISVETKTTATLTRHAEEAAKLLGIQNEVHRLIELKNKGDEAVGTKEYLKLHLVVIRKVLSTGLELRAVSARFDRQITIEQQALDKLSRQRDAVVALTTNMNFLQLGILSTIIDGPLEETPNKGRVLNGNRLNIVSGLTVGGLAAISLAEQRGGFRRSHPEPNFLGQTLGLEGPQGEQLPPFLWTYLNSASPMDQDALTRRQRLIEYWQEGKVLPVNIRRQSTIEQVAGFGPRYHQWCESIRVLRARVTMLFDLRAMVDLLDTGLVEILQALE